MVYLYYFLFPLLKEQPLLLEDLLEQEKREQARHTNVANPMEGVSQNQSLLSDQVNI